MHTLSTLFPAAFPALALSHFVALLSPGPDFFLLVGYAVRYRIRGSIGLCLGIAAGNALYIVLAIVGWGLLRQAPLLFLLIELLGAGYLLWGQPADTQPSRDAGGGEHSRIASGVRQAAAARAGVIAAQPQKRSVLSGADDFPARAGGHPAAANGERVVDGQRGVLLGFTAGECDCAAAGTAPPGRHRLASRAGGRGGPDDLRSVDYLAIFARPRRQVICLSLWKNSLNSNAPNCWRCRCC